MRSTGSLPCRFLCLLSAALLLLAAGCATFISDIPDTSDANSSLQLEEIGRVDAEMTNWNWFFQESAEERRAMLEQKLYQKAVEQFGEDIIIKTETAEGSWNPASLLMFFSALGFVEDAYMEASVWRTIPEPAHLSYEYGIRYIVIPEKDYSSDTEFMIIEYKTREQLEGELREAFDDGAFSENDLKKKQSRLPDTGKIFITLGRADITNAISRWFTFTCTNGNETIFRKRGIEDIPYVYGTDKLWWNDMSYNVGPSWDGELNLRIDDSYQSKIYNYRIVKEVYEIPVSKE